MCASLSGRVCLVTGASRGIGRGIALQLGEAGATVYITGRTIEPQSDSPVGGSLRETAEEIEKRGGVCIPIKCDHSNDKDVQELFERIRTEQDGQLDLLVNNAFAAVNRIMAAMGRPFWKQGIDMWDAVNNVGLRNNYICSVLAAQMMVPNRSGLIVNISSAGGLRYLFNVAYGIGKEAVDRMAVDMAIELKRHRVACVSLWPGAVQTEIISSSFQLDKSDTEVMELMGDNKRFNASRKLFQGGESVEYVGKAIVGLMRDPNLMEKTGRVLLTADLGAEYGLTDVDGREVVSMRSVKFLLSMSGYERLSRYVPSWLRTPTWVFSMAGHKL